MQGVQEDFIEAAVMVEIMHLRKGGGISDWHIEEAQKRLQSIRESDESEAMLYAMRGTRRTFQIIVECLAVMAFCPGGVDFAGRHFEEANGSKDNDNEAG